MSRVTQLIVAASMIACGVSTAVAQSQAASSGRTLRSWNASQPEPAATEHASSTLHIRSSGDGDEYEVIVKDGKASAKLNGKDLPEDRVRQTDEGIEILDDSGKIIKTFHVSTTAPAQPAVSGRLRGLAATAPRWRAQAGNNLAVLGRAAEPPKVMIGITMSTAQDADGVMIDSVIEGLPAEAAGLKAGDLITQLDGKKIEDDGSFRELLRNHAAGDEVKVTVQREGEEKTFTLKLESFDGARLGNMMGTPLAEMPAMPSMPAMNGPEEMHKSLMESLHKALSGVKGLSKDDHENVTRQLEEALSKIFEDNDTVVEVAPGGGGGWGQGMEPGVNVWTLKRGPSGQDMAFTVPGGDNSGELNKKLDRLMKKLDGLEKHLAELQEKLEKNAGGR